MEFLVAEETVGYGPCLEVDSTSPQHLNLVPLMHHIRPIHHKANFREWLDTALGGWPQNVVAKVWTRGRSQEFQVRVS